MAVIDVKSLRKNFRVTLPFAHDTPLWRRLFSRRPRRDVTAVDNMSFSIDQGEQVAFIGPNGAGKSTTLKMLTGILYPTSGSAEVLGLTPWEHRQELASHIGIVFGQRSQLWANLPVIESFDLLAHIYTLNRTAYQKRRQHIVDMLSIGDLLTVPVRQLSLGQRMRCEIAASLLHAPKVLFLDEPTIGLDVTSKAQLRDHLNRVVREEGVTLLLTSHDTGDIEELCRRVIVINNGQLLLDTDLVGLKRDYLQTKSITLVTANKHPSFEGFGVETIAVEDHKIQLAIDTGRVSVPELVPRLLTSMKVEDMVISDPPLEDTIKAIYARHPRTIQ